MRLDSSGCLFIQGFYGLKETGKTDARDDQDDRISDPRRNLCVRHQVHSLTGADCASSLATGWFVILMWAERPSSLRQELRKQRIVGLPTGLWPDG